jgi:cellobiose-specific phosphotransferase system component IIC
MLKVDIFFLFSFSDFAFFFPTQLLHFLSFALFSVIVNLMNINLNSIIYINFYTTYNKKRNRKKKYKIKGKDREKKD